MLKSLSWYLRPWKSWEDSESKEESIVKAVRRYPEGPTLGRKQSGNLPSSMQVWASIRVVHKKTSVIRECSVPELLESGKLLNKQ